MDSYDQEHPETGSSNISKATPEWKEALAEARAAHTEGEYVIHTAYDIVNEQARAGVRWNKCPNCGSPYRLDREGADGTTCSLVCYDEYAAYIMGGE